LLVRGQRGRGEQLTRTIPVKIDQRKLPSEVAEVKPACECRKARNVVDKNISNWNVLEQQSAHAALPGKRGLVQRWVTVCRITNGKHAHRTVANLRGHHRNTSSTFHQTMTLPETSCQPNLDLSLVPVIIDTLVAVAPDTA
jgi:hypothetical protein